MSDRIKAGIWVQAQLRICDMNFISAMVVRKGDPDAGSVLLKLNRFNEGCAVLTPVTTIEGERGWMHGLKDGYVDERTCDAYIIRQTERDPDLWVIEIEDPKKQYELDAELVQ
ncbi:conserved hypothetical protein [Candidatus Terasakiella magnetica]|uniref:DUF1491 family protein n=1 Tax=Candidatus Terasakiella magnetica TaxID=1867952 RepID=A0A1C3RC27_9PROT|nr:DUF1491 family protein [Candidatus Terasakiella magnetica]SCA54798.1 conserved hypothetical protein [Candidatus Terasakiella magnetica]